MAVDMSAEISDQNEQLDIITLKVYDINRTIQISFSKERIFKVHACIFPGPFDIFYHLSYLKEKGK